MSPYPRTRGASCINRWPSGIPTHLRARSRCSSTATRTSTHSASTQVPSRERSSSPRSGRPMSPSTLATAAGAVRRVCARRRVARPRRPAGRRNAMPGRVVVVGLGPAGADHVLPVARAALAGATRRFARTARHPAVEELTAEGIAFDTFDTLYDHAPDLEHAYADIARALVDAADEHGE